MKHFIEGIPSLDIVKKGEAADKIHQDAGKGNLKITPKRSSLSKKELDVNINNTSTNPLIIDSAKNIDARPNSKIDVDQIGDSSMAETSSSEASSLILGDVLMWGKESHTDIHVLRSLIRLFFEIIVILSCLLCFKYCYKYYNYL